MANPRRTSLQFHQQNPSILPVSTPSSDQSFPQFQPSLLHSVSLFLKRPHAFPFLLSVFVLLTWLSLRLQRPSNPESSSGIRDDGARKARDLDANLVRFGAVEFPSAIARDRRGWLLNPVTSAREFGIHGGAQSCASIHAGEIRPGAMRGNHRHHTCNETFIIWGAATKFRLENANVDGKGYGEVIIGADEVAISASPSGTAHALINVDSVRTTFFLGCQDSVIDYNSSTTDFSVWKDL